MSETFIGRIRGLLRSNAILFVVVALVIVGRTSLADHYVVPSGSMEPTLVPGDRVFVDKMAFGLRVPFTNIVMRSGDRVRAGDVVIFDSPENGTRMIKRVVALPGEQVELRNGRLSIDGRSLADPDDAANEIYSDSRVRLGLAHGGGPDFGPIHVPEGRVLVLGDSRGNSRDSRFFGYVEIAELYARAEGVFYRSGFVWLPL
jgi:signal peptidase I